MDISKISSGKNFPETINVVIEISANTPGVKYEFDKVNKYLETLPEATTETSDTP